jgi:hypothetical protein
MEGTGDNKRLRTLRGFGPRSEPDEVNYLTGWRQILMSKPTWLSLLVLVAAAIMLLSRNSFSCVYDQTGSAPVPYFPDATSKEMGGFFADFLHNTGEPSLPAIARKDPKALCYRLDWAGVTSLRLLTIRLSINPDGSAQITTIEGGFQSTEFHKTQLTASADDTKKFLQMITTADFWTMPLAEPLPPPGPDGRRPYKMDGTIWLFEGVQAGNYHVVYRHSPGRGPFTRMVDFLARDLAKIDESWIPKAMIAQ